MGTCVSSRNTMKVSDISSQGQQPDNGDPKEIVVKAYKSDKDCGNDASDDFAIKSDLNRISTYRSPSPHRNDVDIWSGQNNSMENTDFNEEKKHSGSSSISSFEMNIVDANTNLPKDDVSPVEDSDAEEEEDGDYLWIPASLARHMGVARGAGLVSERRVYADDDELYMSVELSRRSSHLTNVVTVSASPAARQDAESEDQKPSYMAKNVTDKIINNFAGLSTSIDSTGFIRDHMEDEWMTFSR